MQTGDDILIGGLIVTGEVGQLTVLVRALGPSLEVDGRLQDPTLELFNENGDSIGFNNNWRDAQEQGIAATTIPPPDDLEAAILAILTPAKYTALVRGVNDSTGVALVEIFALA